MEELINSTRSISVVEPRVLERAFCLSAAFLLGLTGFAKLCSAFGEAKVLTFKDPVIGLKIGHLLLIVGATELLVAGVCTRKKPLLCAMTVAWLGTNLLAYRVCLLLIGAHRPCSCLGGLTDAIHLSPEAADKIMKGLLAYLLIGSYGILFHHWWKKWKLTQTKAEGGNLKAET